MEANYGRKPAQGGGGARLSVSLYVLDTDTLTLLQDGHAGVVQRFNSHSLAEMAITVISVEEQLSGWYTRLRRAKRRDEKIHVYQRLASCTQALAGWKILSFTDRAFVQYDNLKTLKLKIGRMDLSIAAITLENGGTLVTRNLRDFQQIPNLPLENWAV